MGDLTIAKPSGVKVRETMGIRFQKQEKRLCPVCGEPKYVADFHRSINNRTPQKSCYGCRKLNTSRRFFNRIVKSRKFALARILHVKKSKSRNIGKEVNWVDSQKSAEKYLKLPDKIAAILGKTYVIAGDNYKLADDEALVRIRDLLEELDPNIIARNKNKRLSTK